MNLDLEPTLSTKITWKKKKKAMQTIQLLWVFKGENLADPALGEVLDVTPVAQSTKKRNPEARQQENEQSHYLTKKWTDTLPRRYREDNCNKRFCTLMNGKLKQDSTTYLLEWQKSQTLTTPNADEDMWQ